MMVEMTSCAPTAAFMAPAIPPHTAPARAAAASDSVRWTGVERLAPCDPTTIAATIPTTYWPWPPMLNMPHLKGSATASAVRMSGVVRISVCCRLSAAKSLSSEDVHGRR